MTSLTYKIGNGGVEAVQLGSKEIIQRIFVTVRDRNWREILPSQFHSEPDRSVSAGAILHARHTDESIAFEWTGDLKLGADGSKITLEFGFEGRALRDIEVCRLGLVVLHPVTPLIGRRVTVDGPNGREDTVISEFIHPQPIRKGLPVAMTRPFDRMGIDMAEIGSVNFEFTGDRFEIEDQRNWGDASFKTYCTPLSAGFPRRIKAGTVINQRVKISLKTDQIVQLPGAIVARPGFESPPGSAPKIGRVAPPLIEDLEDLSWTRGWHHIRVDLDSSAALGRVERFLARVGPPTKLELGLTVGRSGFVDPDLIAFLDKMHPRISALLISGAGGPLPSAEAIARLRATLRRGATASVPLLVAAKGYFADLNRLTNFPLEADGCAFPLSSTVHGDNASTITENIPAVADLVKTARNLTGKSLISVSPISLYHPVGTGAERWPMPLLTTWLCGVISHASCAGASFLTLGEDVITGLGSGQPPK